MMSANKDMKKSNFPNIASKAISTAQADSTGSSKVKEGILTGDNIKKLQSEGKISIGLFESECIKPLGYEVHLHKDFGVPTISAYGEVDSHKWINSSGFTNRLLPQAMTKHVGYLFSLREKIELPNDIYADFIPKSTWNKAGMTINAFTIDPGYKGGISFTVVSNIHNWRFFPDDAIGTLRFYKLSSPVKPYSGKYQDSEFLSGPVFN